MLIQLRRRYARQIDGFGLGRHRVADVFHVAPADAALLVAERWATRVRRVPSRRATKAHRATATAARLIMALRAVQRSIGVSMVTFGRHREYA